MSSKFALFMRDNKTQQKNEHYAPTASLCNEDGKPLEWEFKRLNSEQNSRLRDECLVNEPNPKNPKTYISTLKTAKYFEKVIVASTVFPDLYDKELQDSYGVNTPEKLLYAMVDNPGEYDRLVQFIQRFNGMDATLSDEIDEAKN